MTYSKRFGKYGIYTDGILYKWFKAKENACEYWKENFSMPEMREEWLDEYDEVVLKDMTSNEIIDEL